MSLFSLKETAFGLDISDRDLRLVQLKKHGKKIFIACFNEIKLPPGCLIGGEIKLPKIFTDNLKKLVKTKHGHGKLSSEVIAVLPETKTYLRNFSLDLTEGRTMEEAIAAVLPQYFPLAAEEVNFDWQVISRNENNVNMLVGVSPKETVSGYLAALAAADLIPLALEMEAAAIARLLIEHNNQPEPQIIADLGANRTGLFLYDQDLIKFNVSLPLSGKAIDQLIADKLGLDPDQAEAAKIACGLDTGKCQGAILELLDQPLSLLAEEIVKMADHYYGNFPQANKIQKVVLCGGGANLANIETILLRKTGLKTALSNPCKNIINHYPKFFTSSKSQSFVTALGLALQGLQGEKIL